MSRMLVSVFNKSPFVVKNKNLYKISSAVFHRNSLDKKTMQFKYPVARKDETVEEVIHEHKIKDVYRWLEDPDSAEVQAFIQSQNNISQPFLQDCPEWSKLHSKITELWNYPKYSCPMKHGSYYYFFKNTGLQNQSVLYRQTNLEGEANIFFDPNTLSSDGTIALVQKTFSHDGKYMAYGLSESGSDWVRILIRDVETKKDFAEVLENVKFSDITWTKDNVGFFYGRYPDQDGKQDGSETKQNDNQKLYYHRIGEPQSQDTLVVEFPEEPTWRIQSVVSDCGKYLILPIVKDCCDNILYYAKLKGIGFEGNLEVQKIIDKFESVYDYITNVGSIVILRTNKNAPNYRVIGIDFENPEESHWTTLIPEHETDVLDSVMCANEDKLLLCYLHDVKSKLQVNSLKTGELIRCFELDIGTITAISGKKELSEIFFNFKSFLNPGTIYHYDFKDSVADPRILREVKLNIQDFHRSDYKISQVFYPSKDGTKIPMFLIHKNRDLVTPRPCLLYGYGGFNCSVQPTFSIIGLVFINEFDGVLAFPNLRGGGEYGERWHNAGRLLNKQNVFDDFQSAAEYLIANKFTNKDRLAIQGASNGGLLIGACINQRPDLFGAAVAQVGVMDMLRFHKFTIGNAWCSDYGSPSIKEHFENLLKFSPLHNVRTPKSESEEYPSTLVVTADHDDRVSPLHSLKFVAALHDAVRDCDYQKKPLLLRVYTRAGHGAGKPTSKQIEEATDILTFFYKSLPKENIDS